MKQETLYSIPTGQYGEILETYAMWQCIAQKKQERRNRNEN